MNPARGLLVCAVLGLATTPCSSTGAKPSSSTTLATRVRSGMGQIVDVAWLDPRRGWALLAGRCGGGCGRCGVIHGTRDGGRTWHRLGSIPAAVGLGGERACRKDGPRCVSRLHFATGRIVYAFDPTLVMTRDGGRSWSRVRGPQVESLVSSGSTVFRLAYRHTGCPGPCHAVIERSTAGSAVWERMAMTKALRGGYGESESLVAAGSSLYAFAWGRIAGGLTSHARIVVSHDLGRRWSVRGDPCGGSRLRENDAFRATAAGHVLAILCEAKDGSGAAFTALSSDRGMTFVRGGPIPVAAPVQIAVNARGELAVGNGGIVGDGTFHYRLALSTDRGRSWRVALRDREPLTSDLAPGSLQYSSARDLSWVGYPHVIWLTSDAGLTWRKSRPAALRPSRG